MPCTPDNCSVIPTVPPPDFSMLLSRIDSADVTTAILTLAGLFIVIAIAAFGADAIRAQAQGKPKSKKPYNKSNSKRTYQRKDDDFDDSDMPSHRYKKNGDD